jgi:hypothetical protein
MTHPLFSKKVSPVQRSLTALALLMLSSTVVYAQQQQRINVPVRGQSQYENPNLPEVPRGVSVFERERPDFEPLEIRAGSFYINPAVSFGAEYNDNIFSSDADTEEDTIFITSPSVRVASDWSRHTLALRAGAKGAAYVDNDKQNYTDLLFGLNGAYDIARGFYVSGGASWQHLHEERGSPNSTVGNADSPVEFDMAVYNVGVTRKMGVFGVDLDFDARNWDYENTDLFNNDTRDRIEYIGTATLSYEFMRDYNVFTRLIANSREYDRELDLQGFQRDSDGWEAQLGANVELTSLVSAEVYGGYTQQDYEDARFDTVDGLTYGTSFLWNVTPMTSVRGTVDREVRDSVLPDISSFLQTTYRMSLEHELKRNVLLGTSVQYQELDFEGIDTDRTDNYYEAVAGGRYLVSRNVTLSLDYTYRTRATDAADLDFVENAIQGGIVFGF